MLLPADVLKTATSTLHWTPRKVERWLRRKNASLRLTTHDKFIEVAYCWIFHGIIAVYGVIVLYSKPYTWNISLCWDGYPYQEVKADLWWFYMMGLTFFWSQTIMLLPQPVKTETIAQYVHHGFTILLMLLSWVTNTVRVGTLVLILHEFSDILLLPGKLVRYLNWKTSTTIFFALFIMTWVFTRVFVFPLWIMRSILFELPDHMSAIPALYVFITLLTGLMFLNLRWTYMIGRMVYVNTVIGEINDFRSSDEYDTNEDTEDFSDARLSSG